MRHSLTFRWAIPAVIGVIFAFAADANILSSLHGAFTTTTNPATVTIVSGTAIPQAEDNAHPSMSRWAPSCLDATWGTGCNVATQTCTAPTSGTPDQPCQSPLQLVVTGGSGNGTTATINYTSYAGYTFPTGPLIVSNALTTAWNTPTGRVTSYSNTTGAPCPGSDQCVTLGLGPALANAFYTSLPIYVGGVSGNNGGYVTGPAWGYGWGTSGAQYQGPNGKFTPVAASVTSVSYNINSTFPTGIVGSLAALNPLGYNGNIIQPWQVTASSCIGSSCSVTFANTTACASSCVNAATQIVAAQFDDPVLAWDTGPIAPLATEGTTGSHMVEKCVDVAHLSHGGTIANPLPAQFVAFALNGGPFVKATTPQLDPWGVGQNPIGDKVNHTLVYCAQFDASLLTDGEYELRAIACPYTGPCGQLTSVITAEATNGSTTLSARAHSLSDTYRLAVTNSQDSAFKVYNGALQNSAITITGATYQSAVTCGLSTPCVAYTFTQPTGLPTIPVGTNVNITGVVNSNSCPVTGGSDTGGAITYTYSGGCSFPVGSEINVTGVTTSSAAITANPNCTYTPATGDVAITLPSAHWGTAPQVGIQYTIGGVTGTNSASVNGGQNLSSSSGSGTVLHFNIGANIGGGVACTGTPTVTPNTYTWNNGVISGNRVGPGTNNHYAVTATNGSSTVTQPGMSTAAWASGGSIAENWNDHCVVVASGSGTITCPIAANSASATWSSGGTIQVNQNVYAVVGGPGDNPSPYDPAYVEQQTLTGDTFNIVPFLSDTGNFQADNVGCHLAPCGVAGTKTSTLWLARPDAGSHEVITDGQERAAAWPNNGSLFGFTNFHGTIQETDGYVDAWNPSAVSSGCLGSQRAATDWNVTGPTFAGSYCGTITQAINGLVWNGSVALTETVSNVSSCTVFTATSNSGAYIGQPVNFQGTDIGVAGDGTNGLFTNGELYWIVGKPASNQITLGTTPGGTCLNETATNLSSVKFVADLSFDNIYLKCNQSLGCSGSNTNPETVPIQSAGGRNSYYAQAGWFSILNDTGNGTVAHSVDITYGQAGGWGIAAGNIRSNVDRNWPTSDLIISNLNTIGPIPGAPTGQLGAVTVTGGSLSGTCPGVACTETLTYTTSDTAGGGHFTTAKFQAPTASAPGQGLVVQNLVNTGGAGSTDWNCGALATPCVVTASSVGSVSFINPNADGTWASAGATPIVPVTLSIEVAAGKLQHSNSGFCGSTSTGIAFAPDTGAVACVFMTGNNTGQNGTTNEFPVMYGRTIPAWSNCLTTQNGGWSINYAPTITALTPGTGGNNDVITLSANSLTNPVYAFNQCTDGFDFTNGQTLMNQTANSSISAWDDSVTVDGPNYNAAIAAGQSLLVHNTAGILYITNGVRHNAFGGVDNSGYTWGSSVEYNLGSCHDSAAISFHTRCIASGDQVPPGPPFYGWNAQQPPHVLHSYDTYAHYLTGPTAEITCSGTPCVADAAHSDSHTASKFFVLSAYGIPRYNTLTWQFNLICGFYPAGLSGGGLSGMTTLLGGSSQVDWQDQTNEVVEVNGTLTGSCVDGPTGSTSFGWFPVYHADTNFWTINNINIPTEISGSNIWTVDKDILIDDQDTTGTGEAEGFLTKGGLQMNVAINHTTSSSMQYASGGWTSIKAWVFQGVPMTNYLIENSNIFANNFYAPDLYTFSLTNTSHTPLFEIWEVNDKLTDGSSSNPSLGFPYSLTLDASHGGVETMNGSIWNAQSDFDAIGGGALNIGMWPSDAAQVNQITGVPITAGKPNSISLKSCPWYCEADDPGSGLY